MSNKQNYQGSPLLFDTTTDKIVGVKNPDNTESTFLFSESELKKIEVEIDASAGGVAVEETICTVPAGAVLMGVIVRSIMAFDGDATTTFDVGYDGDVPAYIDTTDFDPTASSTSACNIGGTTNTITTLQYVIEELPIIATWTNDDNASEGKVKVIVLYR